MSQPGKHYREEIIRLRDENDLLREENIQLKERLFKLAIDPLPFKCTRQQEMLYRMLVEHKGRMVSHEALRALMSSLHDTEYVDPRLQVAVQVTRLRKVIPKNQRIRSIHSRGYVLEETKDGE